MSPLVNPFARRDDELALALERSLARLGSRHAGPLVAALEPEHAFELRPLLTTALELGAVFAEERPTPAARAELLALARRTPQLVPARGVRGALDGLVSGWAAMSANSVARRAVASAAVAMSLGALALLGRALQPGIPAAAATLTVVTGAVERLRGEDTGGVPDGGTVFEGDMLRLGADSIAILTFLDGSTVQLSAGAELTLKRARFGETASIRVEQRAGQVIADLPPDAGAGASLTVEAPGAVIEARSGGFAADVNGEGTRVQAFEEAIAVSSGGGPEVMTPGESRLIGRSGSPAPGR